MDSGKGEMCSRVKEDGRQTAFLFFFPPSLGSLKASQQMKPFPVYLLEWRQPESDFHFVVTWLTRRLRRREQLGHVSTHPQEEGSF